LKDKQKSADTDEQGGRKWKNKQKVADVDDEQGSGEDRDLEARPKKKQKISDTTGPAPVSPAPSTECE